MKKRIRLLAGPPLVGKSTVLPWITSHLPNHGGAPWVYLDNEWGFTQALRVMCAEKSGMKLNSPEFARSFNLEAQLAYQGTARRIADQNFNVLMAGPFENLTPVIDGLPLYRKMKEVDFADYDFGVVQLLLWPETEDEITSENIIGHSAMSPVEAEIQFRRNIRGTGRPRQQALDADKSSPDYFSRRAEMILKTNEAFPGQIELVKAFVGDEPEDIGRRIARAID